MSECFHQPVFITFIMTLINVTRLHQNAAGIVSTLLFLFFFSRERQSNSDLLQIQCNAVLLIGGEKNRMSLHFKKTSAGGCDELSDLRPWEGTISPHQLRRPRRDSTASRRPRSRLKIHLTGYEKQLKIFHGTAALKIGFRCHSY